ncbi:spore germination protein KA [Bacillus freudenreichii]|nr:spore germination protein KA [Bacillus freudenreichii]
MIRNVNKLLRKAASKKNPPQKKQPETKPKEALHTNFSQNVEAFQSIYTNCSDVVFHNFNIFGRVKAMIIYIEGLSDNVGIEESVLTPLKKETANDAHLLNDLIESAISAPKVEKVFSIADSVDSLSTGNPILLYEGGTFAYSFGLAKWEKRAVEEPEAEPVIRGPREGFTESLQVSTSQLRRIIKSPALKIQSIKIGEYTKTNVMFAYVDGLADPTLVEEVQKRLTRIEVDGILESEYIEELIEDNPYSPFPQIMSTERPDVASGALLEGRVVILTEGTPFVLIVPVSFFSFLQAPDDYYQRTIIGSVTRLLRNFFLVLSLLFPSFYVAVTTFHQEMIPDSLLLSISASRESVPFPALVEVILMEVMFEALREAGIRLPKQIGSAVSIVGALVIGQAAVQAGLVSAPMIIIVASTGIASFLIPRYIAGYSIRILRFPIIFLAGTLGLLGIMMGILAIVIHLCALRSFGEPYLAPLAPLQKHELKDVLWRAPLWKMDTRPHFTGQYNEYRQVPNQKPGPKKGGDTDT